MTKRFGDVVAVDHLDLDVADGELLVLLGPSGCGKTTALRMVAGLEEVDEGTITIGDQVVNDIEPKDRDMAMVFQSYALYPHLTVAKNIEFPLRQRGVDRDERTTPGARGGRRPSGSTPTSGASPASSPAASASGWPWPGPSCASPQVFLMDEPLSNLDAALRVQTRADIVALQERLGTTTLYVTHDQVEAMTMGDRIAVHDHGVLQQVAAAPGPLRPAGQHLRGRASSGSPGMNLIPARSTWRRGRPESPSAGGTVPLPADLVGAPRSGRRVTVGVRPEGLRLDPPAPSRPRSSSSSCSAPRPT